MAAVMTRWLMTRSTPTLYFLMVLSNMRLKPAWKRETNELFFSFFSASCGFRNMAHNAGDSVKAFNAEMTILTAIVTPNSR